MLAQLRSAQEEAARLKKELAVLQQQRGPGQAGGAPADMAAKPRIDSTDSREMPWEAGKRTAWLSEADVDFFTGGGATEGSSAAASAPASPEAAATVGRRLALGSAAAAALAGFALVPTKDLRLGRPSQPMYFYLTQLLAAQAQLEQCASLIEDAQWDSLRLILPRIRGSPTNAESALRDVVSLLDAGAASRAEPLASDFLEYLDLMDYNKYYDAMAPRAARRISGAENAEFVAFSSKALKSAQARLAAFLQLVPPEQLAAARAQVAGQL